MLACRQQAARSLLRGPAARAALRMRPSARTAALQSLQRRVMREPAPAHKAAAAATALCALRGIAFARAFAGGAAVVNAVPGQTVPFLLADIGEGITNVKLTQWHVKEGDRVAQFQKVCDVESDKAAVEITSRYDGIVRKLQYKEGDTAHVGSPLLMIEITGAGSATVAAAAAPPPASSSQKQQPAATPAAAAPAAAPVAMDADGKPLATPAVRRIAKEYGVDLRQVAATGPKGNILKDDILRFLNARQSAPAAPAAAAVAAAVPPAPPAAARAPQPIASSSAADRVEKVEGVRKIMAATMTRSHQIPALLFCDEVEVDALVALRKQLQPLAKEKGVKLTYMPFLVKAASIALKAHPRLNSHVSADCTEVTIKGAHHIGVAMDTPRGLLVPNIKHADQRSVFEIALELDRLMQLGQAGKLMPNDLQGGTFTLSNIGTVGGTYAAPLIVAPEVIIGAMGKFQVVPRFVGARVGGDNAGLPVRPVTILNISWSADHRVLEGVEVASFSNTFKQVLENPALFAFYGK